MSLGDPTKYNQLSIVDQGFVKITSTFSVDYQIDTLSVSHNLGFVPIAVVYGDEAGGDHDPASVTATSYTGHQLPWWLNNQAGPITHVYHMYYDIDTANINFYVERWTTKDSQQYTYFFKYFLLSQSGVH